ncbi:hypothetical protein PXH22_004022 [Salmonella enterica]|nr:hypothetical protein [Citrobacter werkmanii]EHG1308588.1 hypothetical protein [Salmonella enterica]EHH6165080.1 hypothetical protein [Salmonella enterica]EHO7416048.1 hypothetical protein [Salmonella enterica]EHP0290035.1 hypothetical protein [Salmonella enterica]
MYSTYVIEPSETVCVYETSTPILPETANNIVITNNGETTLKVMSYWAPPSGVWEELKEYTVPPYDTILVDSTDSVFYYYEVTVTNLSKNITGGALVIIENDG